jgi:glycosyltransferase involved in cell wall biosynthesis
MSIGYRDSLIESTPPAAEGDDAGPIRVLALLDDNVVSGKVKPVLALARYAREDRKEPRRLDISMLTFVRAESDPEFVGELRQEGFSIEVVRERRRFDFSVFAQIRAIVARRRPHILWTHSSKTHFLVRLGGLHRRTAWVASHHGYTATSLAWRLYQQLDRWSLRGADSVITACDAFAADLNVRLGIKKERLSVHRTPLLQSSASVANVRARSIRDELNLPTDARIVLSVGRLSQEKGHFDLIRAMVEVRRACGFPAVLVIVGDGPERARLERLRARLGLEGVVHLVGHRDDVSPYYEAADVFALPSYSEGSPNVLLEAMDAGVPIVARAVGGVCEMIRDGEQGWLAPDDPAARSDSQTMPHGIVVLLSDANLRARFAASARRTLPAYAPSSYYAGVRSVFEKALYSSSGGRRSGGS